MEMKHSQTDCIVDKIVTMLYVGKDVIYMYCCLQYIYNI